MTPANSDPPAPGLRFIFEGRVDLGVPIKVGLVPQGQRRIIPIVGGTFEGPCIKGRILNQGADWQLIRPDGTAEIDTRYILRTDGGAIVYIVNQGIRTGSPEVLARLRAGEEPDPSTYYFRTVPKFETSAPDLQWMTRAIFLCSAERKASQVVIRVWMVE